MKNDVYFTLLAFVDFDHIRFQHSMVSLLVISYQLSVIS